MFKLPKLTTAQVDQINIGLMIVSLILAFILPFEVFLFSYAVLGPLHYLTEISWLHQKHYFIPKVTTITLWIFPVVVAIFIFLLEYDNVVDLIRAWRGLAPLEKKAFEYLWNTNLTLFVFGIACIAVLLSRLWMKGVALVILTIFVLTFNVGQTCISCIDRNTQDKIEFCNYTPEAAVSWVEKNCADLNKDGAVLFGDDFQDEGLKYRNITFFFTAYLATVIHVYLFTLLFMLFGALKSRSRFGILSVATLIICGAMPFIWDPPFLHYTISEAARKSYDVSFLALNQTIFENFFSLASTPENIYGSKIGIMLTRFIAFAYTYHYLNWFSKTSIIQWHKMPILNLGLVLFLWIASVALYYIDYKTGLMALLSLSFLHVFLEFPLNFHSLAGIIKALFGKKAAAR